MTQHLCHRDKMRNYNRSPFLRCAPPINDNIAYYYKRKLGFHYCPSECPICALLYAFCDLLIIKKAIPRSNFYFHGIYYTHDTYILTRCPHLILFYAFSFFQESQRLRYSSSLVSPQTFADLL